MLKGEGGRTFVAVDEVVLDHNAPAIDCVVRLRLASDFAQVLRILPSRVGRLGAGDAENMASQEFLRPDSLGNGAAALGVAGGKEDIGRRNKQDMVRRRRTLRRKGASKEGGQEGVERLHSLGVTWGRRTAKAQAWAARYLLERRA